jgi:hypothetical protein
MEAGTKDFKMAMGGLVLIGSIALLLGIFA